MGELLVGLAAIVTAGIGAIGGMGGAVLLVPLLVLTGADVADAAPLGLLSVAAGSLAAAAPHAAERTVNHRLGLTVEIAGSSGAIAGALVAGRVGDDLLRVALALVAAAAALANVARRGMRNRPVPGFDAASVGEWRGVLAGAYQLGTRVVPYRVSRVPAGLAAMAGAGFIAGVSGVSGGFVKTPVATDILRVPVKVAAPTTTFTVGITSAAALIVFALHDRIDLDVAPAVLAGSIIGGALGARLQSRLDPLTVRRVLGVVLVAVAILLAVA